jgi:hypothetical protein
MSEPSCQRDVQEQLADALPVLGEAALKQALVGLHRLLDASRAPSHQKLLLWLWVLGYERFGQVTFGEAGPSLRIWLPPEGPDVMLALDQTFVPVHIDPVSDRRGGYVIMTAGIEKDPRSVASSLLGHLAKTHAKNQQKLNR